MLAQDEYRWGVVGGTKLAQILRVSANLGRGRHYKIGGGGGGGGGIEQ